MISASISLPARLPHPDHRAGRAHHRVGCAVLAMIATMAVARLTAADADTRRLLAAYVFVGTGSGVVVSADGLVLTNHHVAGREAEPSVRFVDGTVRSARLVGSDPVGDIALLRINAAEGLTAVPLATAGSLRISQEVIAIGNPFALGELDDTPTVTHGVLSAIRLVRGDYADALQVDAAVNPGNSGGPLFDREGCLLGINGQIRTRSGFRVNSGIALAICCTQLAAFLPYLQDADGGYVHHTAPPAGLTLGDDDQGVVVREPGASGLVAGDRLLAVSGRDAVTAVRSRGLFSASPWRSGATLPVTVQRDGQRLELRVPVTRTSIPGTSWHGIEVADDDGQLIIEAVAKDSPAAQAGCQAGDVIVVCNGQKNPRRFDWIRGMARLGIGDRLELELRRGDETRRIVVPIADRGEAAPRRHPR